jgi:hypothetical protein
MNKFLASNDYQKYRFHKHPNIYLIFIESYGRILLDDPILLATYRENLSKNEALLKSKEWHIASHLSLSPVAGGKSWVSYSNILYGYNFSDEWVFNTVSRYPEINRYNHLLRVLRHRGYKNYRLNSMYPSGSKFIPWDEYARFFAIDQWVKYEDLGYTGKLYSFGPSPNDQYALNAALQHIKRRGEGPFTLFFLNQNSHTPFYSPETVAENWRDINDGSIDINTPSIVLGKPKLEDYIKAIQFQISYLSDFIIKNGTENDIFILIGDHQPIIFPDPEDGFETPIHIISQDSSFVRGFLQYGFNEGLLVKDPLKSIKHEGFYSMFMREFVRNYGEETTDLPEYRPNGVTFD